MRFLFKLFMITAVLLIGMSLYYNTERLIEVGYQTIDPDKPAHSDLIGVLMGSDSNLCLAEGLALFKKGYGPKIELSGFPKNTDPQTVIDLKYFNDFNNLSTDHYPSSMDDMAKRLLKKCRQKNYETLLVVAPDYATGRAKAVFDFRFAGSKIRVLVHGASTGDTFADSWWLNPDTRLQVVREYLLLRKYLWSNDLE